MNKVFTDNGWADYVYWETEDRKTLKKINALIEDIWKYRNWEARAFGWQFNRLLEPPNQ